MDPEKGSKPKYDDIESRRLCFQQASDTARHYGNMRFAMFTVFVAIQGALVAAKLGEDMKVPEALELFFTIGALLLAFLFAAAELRVGQLVIAFQEDADKLGRGLFGDHAGLKSGHIAWKYLANATMMAPFVLATIFWVACLFDSAGGAAG